MGFLSDLFGGGDQKKLAAEAAAQNARMRQMEDDRQANVRTGQGNIDQAFAQFNPDYFNNFINTFKGAYNPQVQEQYGGAIDKLKATLAGRGTLASTIGANSFGKLARTRADAEATIGSNATDAANDLRSKVDASKSSLYQLNLGAADPAMAAARASGEASAFAAPRPYGPLGDVFGGFMQTFNAANKADSNSMNPRLPWNTFASGRGSATYG